MNIRPERFQLVSFPQSWLRGLELKNKLQSLLLAWIKGAYATANWRMSPSARKSQKFDLKKNKMKEINPTTQKTPLKDPSEIHPEQQDPVTLYQSHLSQRWAIL